jgi:hypothetical protein
MAKKSSGFRVGNVNYGRFSGVNPGRAANENKTIRTRVNELKNLEAETSRMLKADKSYKLNSGEAAYGKKTPSKTSTASRVAGAIGRNALRAAGPVGALVGMTTPVGVGSDKPPKGISGMSQKDRSAANKATSAKRPTSNSLNAPVRTSSSGSARPTSSSLDAPSRTAPSKASTSKSKSTKSYMGPSGGAKFGNTVPARGGNALSSGRGPAASMAASKASSKSSAPSRPSSGPTSAPSRTAPSKANLGTSRFAKGGAIKRRKK